jgi:cell division septation protein DedD
MSSLAKSFERILGSEYGRALTWAVLLGVVFGFGFVAGRLASPKNLAASKVAKNTLEVLDENEKQYEEVQKKLKLTYYSELLAQPKTQPTETFVPPTTPASLPEVSAEENAPKPSSVPEEKPSSARMAKALATVLGGETPEPVKETIRQSLPSSTGSAFAIQIAALPDREKAEVIMRQLKAQGHPAQLVQADVPGKGVVYRIRLHGFKSREEADAYRSAKGLEGMTVDQSR